MSVNTYNEKKKHNGNTYNRNVTVAKQQMGWYSVNVTAFVQGLKFGLAMIICEVNIEQYLYYNTVAYK